jgi:hypothetical protein
LCDQETEEAKARYRAVKIQPQWVVTAGKQTDKQQTKLSLAEDKDTRYKVMVDSSLPTP